MILRRFSSWVAVVVCLACSRVAGFPVETSAPPPTHPALSPEDGAVSPTNPPSLIWRDDATASRYRVELSPTRDFQQNVVRIDGVPMPFYNHDRSLATGTWFWRYFVVRGDGAVSEPGPIRSFRITEASVSLPIPSASAMLASLPGHPRIFTRPEELADFRARRLGVGREAWATIQAKADAAVGLRPTLPQLRPIPAQLPAHRQQVFRLENGTALQTVGYNRAEILRDAERANLLSLAYLISGDDKYADAAKRWALFVAPFRIDYHLPTVAQRGQHDSVVYAYENGVLGIALAYDRLFARLSPAERRALLDHVEFHGEAAFHWIKDVMKIHLNYQESHAQQCMHALLPTALAIAGESAAANQWLAYIVPQYANRIAWTSDDGGYFEGQSYSFKFSYILEALVALRSATGIDLFQKPAIHNAGDFWLYCNSLNYWWPHWGDNMPLVNPYGNVGDAYISALLAASTGNRPLQWWSETTPSDPSHVPFSYLSATGVRSAPPVAIPQARVFPDTGVVAAYDRFYDHASPRIFFRSSPWGGHSHAHADQNSFVLHAGGEILAADIGYYTYFGDENYEQFTTQTIAHNSVLFDGQGQRNDIEGKGAITGFFHSPAYTFFSGDASQAYGPAVTRFRRDVLYLRPDVFVIADELGAPKAGRWTWTLNGFAEPVIDEARHEFTVAQRGERLWGRQVFPEQVEYAASNRRLHPIQTKNWTRYTDAFPEPWRLQVRTAPTSATNFLTVLHAYEEAKGQRARVTDSHRSDSTFAARIVAPGMTEDVLMRRVQDGNEPLRAFEAESDGRVLAIGRLGDGRVQRWLAIAARSASLAGRPLLAARDPVSIAVVQGTPAALTQISVQAARSTEIAVALSSRPQRVKMFRDVDFKAGKSLDIRWEDGRVTLVVPEGKSVFWIDPKVEPSALPKEISLRVSERTGEQHVALETAIAENGDWVAFGTFPVRQTGTYTVRSSAAGSEILLQDRWDPERSVRGGEVVSGLLCEGTRVIVRFPPGAVPEITAELTRGIPASDINLLRNGDFEVGLPHYPPRGWTVRHGSGSEFVEARQGFPEWSTEAASSGRAALKFTRPLNRLIDWRAPFAEMGRDLMSVNAPPVRLLQAGAYRVTWQARGTATAARFVLTDSNGKARVVDLAPSPDWRGYQLEATLPAGYTDLKFEFRQGGADDQILWVDDVKVAVAPVVQPAP